MFTWTSSMPCLARRLNMWPMMGVSTTGARGFGISPVRGKRRVPLPAASAMAFMRWLPFSALVASGLLLEGALKFREVEQVPHDVVDLLPQPLPRGGHPLGVPGPDVPPAVSGPPDPLPRHLT